MTQKKRNWTRIQNTQDRGLTLEERVIHWMKRHQDRLIEPRDFISGRLVKNAIESHQLIANLERKGLVVVWTPEECVTPRVFLMDDKRLPQEMSNGRQRTTPKRTMCGM